MEIGSRNTLSAPYFPSITASAGGEPHHTRKEPETRGCLIASDPVAACTNYSPQKSDLSACHSNHKRHKVKHRKHGDRNQRSFNGILHFPAPLHKKSEFLFLIIAWKNLYDKDRE